MPHGYVDPKCRPGLQDPLNVGKIDSRSSGPHFVEKPGRTTRGLALMLREEELGDAAALKAQDSREESTDPPRSARAGSSLVHATRPARWATQ